MMKHMLDTNMCIYLIRKHPPEIVRKFDSYRKGEIVISSITWAELCCGIQKEGSAIAHELLSMLNVCPFCTEQGHFYGELTRRFPNRKNSLDRMIAAHALSLDITLITNNEADFIVYAESGLHIENWIR